MIYEILLLPRYEQVVTHDEPRQEEVKEKSERNKQVKVPQPFVVGIEQQFAVVLEELELNDFNAT